MSSKTTIFLTRDNEHCYVEFGDIIVEFDRTNVEIIQLNNEDLILKIRPGSELYEIFKSIKV